MNMVDRLKIYVQLMRLDKPIGILLLLWPMLWGLWFAAKGMPDAHVLVIFVLGTVLMRSAGCVINDFADRKIDPHVERTKNRPMAAGKIGSKEAILLAAGLSLCAFLLILPLNQLTILLSVPALFLAGTYPFTKRFFAMPQAYLGIAFSFGIPMAFAAQTNSLPPLIWILMLANLFWVIAYDTAYAIVDKPDDLKIGIKTSAITMGRFDVHGRDAMPRHVYCHYAGNRSVAGDGHGLIMQD
jgi:4-hydroxybenzoate polyprenyltransferase